MKTRGLIFFVVLIFLINFLSAQIDYSNCEIYGNCPKTTSTISTGTGGNITNNYYNSYYNATGNTTQFTTSGDTLTLLESWLNTWLDFTTRFNSLFRNFFNQDLNTTASPKFVGINITGNILYNGSNAFTFEDLNRTGSLTGGGGNINASTTTCSGTDKFSAYDNATGVFTCTPDEGGGGGDSLWTNVSGVATYNGNISIGKKMSLSYNTSIEVNDANTTIWF